MPCRRGSRGPNGCLRRLSSLSRLVRAVERVWYWRGLTDRRQTQRARLFCAYSPPPKRLIGAFRPRYYEMAPCVALAPECLAVPTNSGITCGIYIGGGPAMGP